jgi:hypothetical protein
MGALYPGTVEHGDRVGNRPVLAVGGGIVRRVGRRVAARRVGDALVGPGEEPDLRLPAPVVSGELMDEQQRSAGPGDLGMQPDAVVSPDRVRHGLAG